jgi:hypothetical protein
MPHYNVIIEGITKEAIMGMNVPEWIKPAVWGGIFGAVFITAAGFSADLVVTSGTAEEQASVQAEQAVTAALTPICVAQFRKVAKDKQEVHIAALQNTNLWLQGDYIEEQGWATMPGSKDPEAEVADACARELLKKAAR